MYTMLGDSYSPIEKCFVPEDLWLLSQTTKCCHDSGLLVQKSIYLGDNLEPTCMAHPPTYLNKVLIGFADGTVQLRNINSDTLLYTFSMESRICCIEPSPALDVVGLGLADGSAVLLNVKFDEVVMKLGNAAGAGMNANAGPQSESQASPCTCLAFRYVFHFFCTVVHLLYLGSTLCIVV